MIQEKIGTLWRRIHLYKNLMVLTLAFNVFAALSGAICSYLVWNGAFDLSKQIIAQESNNQKLLNFEKLLEKAPQLKNQEKLSRLELLSEIQAWEKLKLHAENLNFSSYETLPADYLSNEATSQLWLANLKKEAQERRLENSSQLLKMAQREDQLSTALIWLGALTVIFGIAIPMLVLGLLTRALRQAQLALTEAAREIVQSWSAALDRHGNSAFKNPHFWIEALLIFGEQMGHYSRHPAMNLTSELSQLVRQELQRSNENKTAA